MALLYVSKFNIPNVCFLTYTIQRIVQRVQAVPEKGVMGKEFRAKSKLVMQKLSEMNNDQVEALEATLKDKGYTAISVLYFCCL